jgi:hypothetical protein
MAFVALRGAMSFGSFFVNMRKVELHAHLGKRKGTNGKGF